MTDNNSGPAWSEEQWNTVRRTVHDEALRSRVAASFLPLFGPLDGDVQTVPRNKLEFSGGPEGNGLAVLDYDNIRLATLSVNIYLKNSQMADPEMTSALIMFRRAAEIVARFEDAIIFNGQKKVDDGPNRGVGTSPSMEICKVSGGEESGGLLEVGDWFLKCMKKPPGRHELGPQVFNIVVQAIQKVESNGYQGPFACVMGDDLFTAVTTPIPNSMVLPRDGILPFLDGPLLRSSTLPPGAAIVVSLRGAPVEIVVPSDVSVRYLATTSESQHVFRVQQKFILRVKEAGAVATLEVPTTEA